MHVKIQFKSFGLEIVPTLCASNVETQHLGHVSGRATILLNMAYAQSIVFNVVVNMRQLQVGARLNS